MLVFRKNNLKGMSALTASLFLLQALPSFAANADQSPNQSTNNTFTYQGRLLNTDGLSALNDIVDFNIGIYDPSGSCLIYEETQTNVDVTTSDGVFGITVGSDQGSAKRTGNDIGLTMNQVFSNLNKVELVPPSSLCPSGYTPLAGDNRTFRVSIRPHASEVYISLKPDLSINSVPYAKVAETLGGHPPTDFMFAAPSGSDVYQAPTGAVYLSSVTTAGTYPKVTFDAKGRILSGQGLANSDITAGLGYVPLNRAGDTITGGLTAASGINITSGGMGVTGTLSANNGVTVTSGGATITGNTSITGNTTTSGALSSGGNLTSGGTLTVAGASTLNGALTVASGGASITGNTSTTGTLSSGGNLSSGGTLTVAGASTLNGALSVTAGGASITGNTSTTGTLSSGGNLSSGGTLTVAGASTLNGALSVTAGGASITGNTSTTGTLSSGGNLSSGGTLTVAGTSTLTGAITAGGAATFAGKVGIGTTSNMTYDLNVNGVGAFGDAYDAAGYAGGIQIARPAAQGDNKFHLSFIRSGNRVFGMGFLSNSNVFNMQNSNDNSGSAGISINTNNNVGIGTTNPTQRLVVDNSANAASAAILVNSAASQNSQLLFNVNGSLQSAITAVPSDTSIRFYNNGSDRMTISSSGNIGIGTTGPQANLDIVGSTYLRNVTGAAGTGYAIELSTNSSLPRVDFVNNGAYVGQFSSNATDVIFKNNLNNSGNISFQTNTGGTITSKMYVRNDGNVGIGTTNPGAKLEVNGNTIISGNLTVSGTTNFIPAGTVTYIATSTVPAGWLECDGAAVSRTGTNAALFAAIGTTFGAGNGSTTFNVPDLRGEFVRGWDHGRNVDAGRAFGSWQVDDFKSHTHGYQQRGYDNIRADTGGDVYPPAATVGTWSQTTAASGGTETRPRNVALMAIIKL